MADHLTPTPYGSGPAYRTAGPDDGDPLVLLTAPQDTADAWAPVRDALARGRRIYAPDLVGPTGGDRAAAATTGTCSCPAPPSRWSAGRAGCWSTRGPRDGT
ncbi:hypothetical protein [Streptomyces erythrochromogenes]|uniref:hypothetical protein n=1 Tax=Streptomyces erythrochromogenes TaxID=285574 RepID=UPI0033D2A088